MQKLLFLFIVSLLSGCQTTPPPKPVIKIDSEPRGARIFFGSGPNEKDAEKTRSYLGVTPLEWTVPDQDNDNGKFKIDGSLVYSLAVPPAAVFFAEPPSGKTNLLRGKQVFHSGTPFVPGDKIPTGIFFDLTKPLPK
jgi:hypothetical protein